MNYRTKSTGIRQQEFRKVKIRIVSLGNKITYANGKIGYAWVQLRYEYHILPNPDDPTMITDPNDNRYSIWLPFEFKKGSNAWKRITFSNIGMKSS